MLRRTASLALCAGVAWVLSGCAEGDVPNSSPYAAEFAEAMESANEYQRAILEDGEVTREELIDAQSHVVSCLAEAGFTVSYQEDEWGNWGMSAGAGTEEFTDASWECEQAWMGSIGTLYNAVRTRPDGLNLNDSIAACLVREGLVPEGFTGDDYAEAIAPYSTFGYPDGSVVTPSPSIPYEEATLPGGTLLEDHEVLACQMNPTHE